MVYLPGFALGLGGGLGSGFSAAGLDNLVDLRHALVQIVTGHEDDDDDVEHQRHDAGQSCGWR